MLNQETAKAARTDSGYILRAPRRMRVADAVAQYMRVPMGAGNSVPWDPLVAPYVIEPMNCLASREYDAVIFVGPARTGKTIGLIDGWVIYNVICDPASDDGGKSPRTLQKTTRQNVSRQPGSGQSPESEQK